jgi:hypothetical protein
VRQQRRSLAANSALCRKPFEAPLHGQKGWRTADQDKTLRGLESGEIKLDDGVDSKALFAMLLQNAKEGYLSDPIYGGNKDMGAWKMIGFPGRAVADSASAKVEADTSGSSRNDQNPLWLIAGAMAFFFAVAAAFLAS